MIQSESIQKKCGKFLYSLLFLSYGIVKILTSHFRCGAPLQITLTVVKDFGKNAPKSLLHKNIFTNNPRGQAGVALQHFCEINFATKQRNVKFTTFHLQNKLVYSILLLLYHCGSSSFHFVKLFSTFSVHVCNSSFYIPVHFMYVVIE